MLYSAGQLAAGEHHPSAASQTFQANVRTQAGDLPNGTPAWMGFSHLNLVV
jgi:hypothetical protein